MIATKRGLSEVIGYVLLISISLTLASLVFTWLKGYLPNDTSSIECEENVALVIRDFNYTCGGSILNLTIQNRGLFNVDGYILRVNNGSISDVGIYTLNKTGRAIPTGELYFDNYTTIQTADTIPKPITGNLTLVEIQPLVLKKNKLVYCSNFISKQRVSCP